MFYCVGSINQGTISPLLNSLKVGDVSNVFNFAPFPLRSDAVQMLFLVKYATVKGCRLVKRLQFDDVCDGQLISESPQLKISSKPLLIPELDDVKYNTYALLRTFFSSLTVLNLFADNLFADDGFQQRSTAAAGYI